MIKFNGVPVEFGQFPNGEANLPLDIMRVFNSHGVQFLSWFYEDDSEFFKLALLADHIRLESNRIELDISYMPHSRMDRSNGEFAFALKTAANLVNAMGFDSVFIHEPHSDVSMALIDSACSIEWCMNNIDAAIRATKADTVFFPDAGAAKRYSTSLPYAVGHKMRDFKSGDITSFNLIGDVGDRVLIVDDLCSRGGTFVHSSKLLREHGAKKVSLLVAHCENTVFTGELFDHIDLMLTADFNQLSETRHNLLKI